MTIRPPESGGCSGYCRACATIHRLPAGKATREARHLLGRLEDQRSIDLFSSGRRKDPELSTAVLFGPSRGKMFGVLECQGPSGRSLFLYGFSGQYNGRWIVPGWAPPVFNMARFKAVHDPNEALVKKLGAQIDTETDPGRQQHLRLRRRELSRRLMKDIHGLYRLQNFRGKTAPLSEVVGKTTALPTGIGDCCAPKLLTQAAGLDLTPLSIAEFYFGLPTPSGTRKPGFFYEPCRDKCAPLLGFLLCGAAAPQP